jgi:hypothetical protein
VTIAEASPEIKMDPEYDPTAWLIVREGPNQNSRPAGKTGAVGRMMADSVDGEWTHLASRGWVRTKFIERCTTVSPTRG